jgi:hypothetical protein
MPSADRQGGITVASPSPVLDELGSAYPDHHLWRNGRLWWIAFTIHRGHLQERVRHSLGTADRAEARARRDEVLARYAQAADCRLSLRIEPPRRRALTDAQRVSVHG